MTRKIYSTEEIIEIANKSIAIYETAVDMIKLAKKMGWYEDMDENNRDHVIDYLKHEINSGFIPISEAVWSLYKRVIYGSFIWLYLSKNLI